MECYLAIKNNEVRIHATASMNLKNGVPCHKRPHIVSVHFNRVARISKSIEMGSRLAIARVWEGEGLQVSTPSPSWEMSSAPSFEGTAAHPSLGAGADNCLSSPRQRPVRAIPGREPATPSRLPHPSTGSPPKLSGLLKPRFSVSGPRPGGAPASAGGTSPVAGAARSLRGSLAHRGQGRCGKGG
uniref:Uncharacterized protein n=1 Tax=Rousettus aegyptiacus TaxID=9407 RepID=A0A7J8HRH4_ROUAE|nr:hypothetical protein HJG63_011030 [Rousettus aegyptiacus]